MFMVLDRNISWIFRYFLRFYVEFPCINFREAKPPLCLRNFNYFNEDNH
ncbi:hypothetical protein BQ9231_00156 [Cedratvirus lausannensis]|uniref:Uncharacterized protein n=1 Tax=Cedratvirus lausannensis TaxID=2023205 RepID=A0A285PWP3_9VIRU|nr:hypothetical protein BQ9231_00156 [Cedratvirus lausannensis]